MNTFLLVINSLKWLDGLALVVFFGGWAGYDWFASDRGLTRPSILASANRVREQWMMQTTYRDNRIFDGSVIQNLSSSPSFFASTTVFIIGGVLAALGSRGKVGDAMRDIPFVADDSTLLFDIKLILLLAVFVYAFFRFTWAMRQYSFGALLMASAPEAKQFEAKGLSREAFAKRAGKVVSLAAETFNDGLRAYYMSFAAVGWFFSPVAFMLGTLGVIYILFKREFHSDVLNALNT